MFSLVSVQVPTRCTGAPGFLLPPSSDQTEGRLSYVPIVCPPVQMAPRHRHRRRASKGPVVSYYVPERASQQGRDGLRGAGWCKPFLRFPPSTDVRASLQSSPTSPATTVSDCGFPRIQRDRSNLRGGTTSHSFSFLPRVCATSPSSVGMGLTCRCPPGAERHIVPNINSLATSTGDDTCLQQVRQWLETCSNAHGYCNVYRNLLASANHTSFQPTRLIEILPGGLRLVSDTTVSRTWVALSHRWPADESSLLRLTATNINDWHTQIPTSAAGGFSQVFVDAVIVCRSVGILYLWIDCLCIIQLGDNGVDWRHVCSQCS